MDETILYFLGPDDPVVVNTTADACKELDSTLDNFFRAHKDRDFKKLRDNKCQQCGYEPVCQ